MRLGIRTSGLAGLALALGLIGASPSNGLAATKYFTYEHVDIEAVHDGSKFGIELHDHEADEEFEVDDSVFVISESLTRSGVSAGAAFDFLGVAPGEQIWVSPAGLPTYLFGGDPFDGLNPVVPYVGLANGGNPPFAQVRFLFDETQYSGPGVFSLFSDTGLLLMSSNTSLGATQRAFTNSHTHYNFAFSEEGTYLLPFQVEGRRSLSSTTWEGLSDTYFIQFQVGNAAVVPEPASLAMVSVAGLAALGLGLARRVRRGKNEA